MDIAALVGQLMPYVSAAIGAYGAAVLTKAQDAAAEGTVSLGRRLLQRINQPETGRAQLEAAITAAAQMPEDENAQVALRVQIKKALTADANLAAEVAQMLATAPALAAAPGAVTAIGNRAAAISTNSGVIQFGDDSTAQR